MELKHKGVTLRLLHEEYKSLYPETFYQYTKFCDIYQRWKKQQALSCRQTYQAGDCLCVDYTGPTGLGKSWLACALGHQACRLAFSVLYGRLSRFLDEFKRAHADGTYLKVLSKYLKIDLLILDDWGLERLTQEQRRDLLECIEDRHTFKSLLMTSQ